MEQGDHYYCEITERAIDGKWLRGVADFGDPVLSNPQIAAKLLLSPRTIVTHISHILQARPPFADRNRPRVSPAQRAEVITSSPPGAERECRAWSLTSKVPNTPQN